MEKIRLLISTFCLVFFSIVAKADYISPERARTVAENFLSQKGENMSLELSNKSTRAADVQDYYIFNSNGIEKGFVIVSADDSTEPILAYSYDSEFISDNMPEHVAKWMEQYSARINENRSAHKEQTPRIKSMWSSLENGTNTRASDTRKKVLETASWNQGKPYNNKAPKIHGYNAYTGCVATATAIIMKYHNWPEYGTGTIPGYSYTSEEGTFNIAPVQLGHKYNWQQMPMTTKEFVTSQQEDEVATLMRDIGVMCEMQYGSDGSSASTPASASGLVNYMGYENVIQHLNYKSTITGSVEKWLEIIIREIDEDRPVLYDGDSEDSGHAFVVDGYEGNNIHINFGWGGLYNGFYTFPDFYKYNKRHSMHVFIMKRNENRTSYYSGIEGIVLESYPNGRTRKVMLYLNGYTGNTAVRYALVDKNRNIKSFVSDIIMSGFDSGTECTVNEPMEIGDGIVPYYLDPVTRKWTALQHIDFTYYDEGYSPIPISELEAITRLSYNFKTGTAVLKTHPEAMVRCNLQDNIMETKGNGLFQIDYNKVDAMSLNISISIGFLKEMSSKIVFEKK